MKVAIIAPVPLLEKYCNATNYHMALTHLVLSNKQYADFYRRKRAQGDYVILDNSLIELGGAASIDKVLRAAAIINPSEIVLPDSYLNSDETLRLVDGTLNKYHTELSWYKLMAVAQGSNQEEWLRCHNELKCYNEISCIAIPKNTATFDASCKFLGRVNIANTLHKLGTNDEQVEYHALGCWDNPIEIKWLARYKWIRGIDSIIPIVFGRHGIAFDLQEGVKVNRPQGASDFESSYDPFPMITAWNVLNMINWGNCE